MHIKFLNHGKGSAAHASAYVLDELDHLGNIRAGVEVLRGDATTFNAICDASAHLWKYTSGIIAWSKEDQPTHAQIQEILNDFEQHAFSGLDPSQYHLFAVLHTDDDGSKHIHVLMPRLDLHSGKSLNIAPPGHEKHFDALRDYFNIKYQWSRPDDLLLMQTTQEPNHIAKLNAQAKNILTHQNLETLTKKQFCKTVDNYVQTLLKTQIAKSRADIVDCIEQVKGVDSVKKSQNFLTVILSNGKKHRLKGDFYNEQFEIGLYSERLRAEAESRPTANELEQAIRDAQSLRDDYRAKRAAYHAKQYAFTTSTTNDYHPQIASQLDIERNSQPIAPSLARDNSWLQSTNRGLVKSARKYQSFGSIQSENQHRFVFNLTSKAASEPRSAVTQSQNRPNQHRENDSNASRASYSEPKPVYQQSVSKPVNGKIEQPESISWATGDDHLFCLDSFHQFLFRLSSTKQSQNHRSTKANYSAEFTSNHESNQYFEQPKEIRHAERNRPIFDRAKQPTDAAEQLVNRTKQSIEPTNRFIQDHLNQLQRSRTAITRQNQPLTIGKENTTSPDLNTQRRTIPNRAGEFFTGLTEKLSNQLKEPITNAINTSFKLSELKQYCEQFSGDRTQTHSKENDSSTNRSRAGALETFTTESLNQYRRRLEDSGEAARAVRNNTWQLNHIDREVERLIELIEDMSIKPKLLSKLKLISTQHSKIEEPKEHSKIDKSAKDQENDNNNDYSPW